MNGAHIVANLLGCNFDFSKESELLPQFADICTKAGFTVVGTSMHKFEPQGITFCILLSESHMSLHTWPELGTVAFDLYTCNHTRDNTQNTLDAFEAVKAILQPTQVDGKLIERGSLSEFPLPTSASTSEGSRNTQLKIVSSATQLYDAAGELMTTLVGVRHWDALMANQYEKYLLGHPNVVRYAKDKQGFITSKGDFVGREEAFQIARAAGQLLLGERISLNAEGVPRLYSENVW